MKVLAPAHKHFFLPPFAFLLFFCSSALAQKTIHIDVDSYAAVAVSESLGKYAYAYNYRSRRAAEKEALKQLGDAPDAKIACWNNGGFMALGKSNEKSCWGIGWVYGSHTRTRDAIDMALENVKKFCTDSTGAYIALVLSSDGQYLLEAQPGKNSFVDQDGEVHQGQIGVGGGTTTVVTKDGKVFKYDANGKLIEGPDGSSGSPSRETTKPSASSSGAAFNPDGTRKKN